MVVVGRGGEGKVKVLKMKAAEREARHTFFLLIAYFRLPCTRLGDRKDSRPRIRILRGPKEAEHQHEASLFRMVFALLTSTHPSISQPSSPSGPYMFPNPPCPRPLPTCPLTKNKKTIGMNSHRIKSLRSKALLFFFRLIGSFLWLPPCFFFW